MVKQAHSQIQPFLPWPFLCSPRGGCCAVLAPVPTDAVSACVFDGWIASDSAAKDRVDGVLTVNGLDAPPSCVWRRAVAPSGVRTELEVFKDGRRVTTIPITEAFHTLGRNSEMSTTAVEGDTVSRVHAAIFHDKDGKSFVSGRACQLTTRAGCALSWRAHVVTAVTLIVLCFD